MNYNFTLKYFFVGLLSITNIVLSAQTYYISTGGTVTTCSGNFTDSGGPPGSGFLGTDPNYSNNENYTRTFCATNAGDAIRFDFSRFETEGSFDFFYVYDGSSTASPLIGQYSGISPVNFPWAFVGKSGCLTFQFTSDGSTTKNGWMASISCWAPPIDCNGNTKASDDCAVSPQICNLNGYCGSTSGWYAPDHIAIESATYNGNGAFCGSIENNSWISFTADGTSASFNITVTEPIAAGTTCGSGIQLAVYDNSLTNCGTFTPADQKFCQSPILGSQTISVNGLTPGQDFQIMIDGFGGDYCDYEITANTGITVLDITSSLGSSVCPNQATTLFANAPLATGYSWSSSPVVPMSSTTLSTITATITQNTVFTVTVTGVCGGTEIATIPVNVNNPTIGFFAEQNTSPYTVITPFPNNVGCTDAWFYLTPNDSATAGGYITPALHFIFTTDGNAVLDGTTFQVFSGGTTALGSGNVIYNGSAPANNTALTVYGDGLNPTRNYYIEVCDGTVGNGGIDWEVKDGNTNTTYGSGAMITGNPCERYGPFSPAGVATWTSNPVIPDPLAFNSFPNGQAYFDPGLLSPGSYTVTYSFDNTVGCVGSASQVITIGPPPTANAGSGYPQITCATTSFNLNGLTSTDAAGVADGAITYAWTAASGGNITAGSNTGTPTISAAGVYNLVVTETNGCTDNASVTITQNTTTPTANAGTGYPDLTCLLTSTNLDGTASTDATGTANGNITYAWSASGGGNITAGGNTATPTVNAAGTYTLTVTDTNNGCTATDSEPIVVDAVNPTVVATSCNDVTTIGGSDGSVLISVAGTSNPYTYIWSNGATTQNITGLGLGTYNVTATGVNGCPASTGCTVNDPSCTITVSVPTTTPVSCNGGTDGTATAQMTGGTGAITYLWVDGQTTATAVGLSQGSYGVTVSDGSGCVGSSATNITEPSVLTLIMSGTNVACNGDANGSVTATAGGGPSTNYTYNWSNAGGNVTTINGLSGGIFTVTVTSGTCTIQGSYTITEPTAIVVTASSTSVTCNGDSDGTAAVVATGGPTTNYSYNWSNGGSSPSINGLSGGNYTVTVTSGVCTTVTSVSVTELPALVATTATTPVGCGSASDGTATVAAAGGTGSYTYLWNPNGETTASINNLAGGGYGVTVTSGSCSTTGFVSVTEPAGLSLTINGNVITCNSANDGAITTAVTGGPGSYTYLWSPNGETTSAISNLSANTYSVIVSSGSCTATDSYTVTEPTALAVTLTDVDIPCGSGNIGSVSTTVTGGPNSTYTYDWTPSLGNVGSATGLAGGNYTVTVTSGVCTTTATTTINQPASFTVTIPAFTALNCTNTSTTINAALTGGTSSMSYNWTTAGGNIIGSNTGTSININAAGTYTVSVTDNIGGCAAIETVTVSQSSDVPSITMTCNATTAVGGTDGSSSATVGTAPTPYTYVWPSGATTSSINGLSAGSYTVTVTSSNGCTGVASCAVNDPGCQITVSTTVTQNVTCNGGTDGAITATMIGGTQPLSYAWDGGQSSPTAIGLPAGAIGVTITDNLGCVGSTIDNISESAPLVLNTSGTMVSCNGASDGTATVIATGGPTTNYTYAWSNGDFTQGISNLVAGNYLVTVSAGGCVVTNNYSVTEALPIAVTVTKTDVTCNNLADGTATVGVAGSTTSYLYQWDDGNSSTTYTIGNLDVGSYTVTVTEINGCSAIERITITEPLALTISTTVSQPSCGGSTNGSIITAVQGGQTPYAYTWTGGATTPDLQNLSSGTYGLTVTGVNSCSQISPITLTASSPMVVTVSAVNSSCGSSTGQVFSGAVGGTTPYTYTWTGGQNSQSLSNVSAGIYGVTITDASNCVESGFGAVSNFNPSLGLDSIDNISCFGADDGVLYIKSQGGTTPYSYYWGNLPFTGTYIDSNVANPSQNIVVTGMPAGVFGITIVDNSVAPGPCKAVIVAIVTEPAELFITLTENSTVSCSGVSDGAITSAVNGGATPYTYAWNTAAVSTDLTNVGAGNYMLTITDGNSCSKIDSIEITEPIPVQIASADTLIYCQTAVNLVDMTTMATPSTGGTWTASSGVIISSTGILNIGSTPWTVGGLDTIYYVVNGCRDSILLDINGANAGNDTVICSGPASFVFSPTATPTGGVWTGNGVSNATTGQINLANVSGTNQYIYESESCPDSVLLTVNLTPSAPVLSNDTICDGANIFFALNANNSNVLWYSDTLLAPISTDTFINQTVSVYDTVQTYYYTLVLNGCTSNVSAVSAIISDSLVASFTAAPTSGTIPLDVIYTNTSVGANENFDYITWNFGDEEYSADYHATHTFNSKGTFITTLIIEDFYTKCIDSTSVTIKTDAKTVDIIFPTVFTPDGDGINDMFTIGHKNLLTVSVRVYNRWGELVYGWDEVNNGWDGVTFAGEKVPVGTYFYTVTDLTGEDENGNTITFEGYSGSISLLRGTK